MEELIKRLRIIFAETDKRRNARLNGSLTENVLKVESALAKSVLPENAVKLGVGQKVLDEVNMKLKLDLGDLANLNEKCG